MNYYAQAIYLGHGTVAGSANHLDLYDQSRIVFYFGPWLYLPPHDTFVPVTMGP